VAGENAGALAFHARVGFAEVGRIPRAGWKFGRWLDLVLMQRLL
jgi:phosphinothricin acetyltransferase